MTGPGPHHPDEPRSMPRYWTVADLAERWQCSPLTVMRRAREKGLPFLWLGEGEYSPARGKRMMRFRPEDVERWETMQLVTVRPEPEKAPAPARPGPAAAVPWWGGKKRTRSKRR